ncbi:ABC1 kinase family protein [Saccharothrix stipae]
MTDDNPRVSAPRLVARSARIFATVLCAALLAVPIVLSGLVTGGRAGMRRNGYRLLVRTLQALGPTFVKFGQISSTRRDTMPAELCEEMGRLHDRVRPLSPRRSRRVLRDAGVAALAEVDTTPLASGSIASVYRGSLHDGTPVAVKVKRPGIDAVMRADLALLRGVVRLAQKAPKLRGMPLADLVGYMSRAILGQLDFRQEAANARTLRECLAGVPEIVVPSVHHELSTTDCLVFEYVPDLDANTPAQLPHDTRVRLAGRTLTAVRQMFFTHGFVHCDLHPGNIYLTRDERVVVLDAGYCVRLPDRVRDLIGEFFMRLVFGDGRRCGEIVLESAVDTSSVDREAFIQDMADVVAEFAGPGNRLDMAEFGNAVFAVQQRHGIYAASDFAFPLMSLNVLDGTVRRFSEEVDLQEVGRSSTPPRAA